MTQDIKPYSAYKDSGVEWLGIMPDHWKRLPGRACFLLKQVSNKGLPETTVLSLSYGQIKIKPKDKLHGLVPESFETYQIVDPGDIICRPTDLQNDWNSLRFGLCNDRGIITSAYMCFHTHTTLIQEYGHLLLHTYDLKKVFYGLGSGLRQNLDWKDFKYLPCLVPPLSEQTAIVRFLDYADRRIRRYIRVKQQLIKLLEEQKQTIIHHAVTHGLDPNVRLKPSGVEWLGDVPEHWEVRPLKYWARINARTITDQTDPDFMFRYLDIGTVGTGTLLHDPKVITFKNAPSRARRIVRKGDTIISTVRTYLKAIYFVEENESGLIASTGFAVLTPHKGVVPRYLSIVAQSANFIDRITANSIGIAYPAISETRLGCFKLAMPPTLEEQEKILRHIDEHTIPYETAISRARREIDLLREYRTRLIADVVTGKLDVHAAANLPDENEEGVTAEEPEDISEAIEDDPESEIENELLSDPV